jgi:hypothetical protein
MVRFLHAPICWADFNAAELETCQLVGPAIPNWLQRESYFLSNHVLYLTIQHTKVSDFGVLESYEFSVKHQNSGS